ncbi:MAG: FtsB family cell division protein [Actinomycetota bacterium]
MSRNSRPRGRKPPARRSRWGIVPQLVALLLVMGLAGAMAIEPTRQLIAQRDRIGNMSDELRDVNQSNRALQARIDRLNDPDYLEQQARATGLVRPGETVYNVVPPSRRKLRARGSDKPNKRATSEQPESSFMERFLGFVGLR